MNVTPNIYGIGDWSIGDETDPYCAYYGFLETSQEDDGHMKCAIVRVTVAASVTKVMWAGGSTQRIFNWADRAALTYKYL
jgi:hypothetical protein